MSRGRATLFSARCVMAKKVPQLVEGPAGGGAEDLLGPPVGQAGSPGLGVDVLYVAELLGHSSPAITMNVYQHVRRDRLAGAASAIAEAFRG